VISEPRRSRLAWPKAPEPPEGCPHVAPKRAPLFIAYACIAMLTVAVAGIMIYLLSKSAQRDQQIEDTNQEVRKAICQLLDGLPAGGVLDVSRAQFGCGPGTPIDQFPPEVRQQFSPSPTPAPAPATVVPAQPSVEPSVPSAPLGEAPVSPEPPAGATGTMGRPEPPPLSPPSLVRELLCDALGVECAEVG
jgi:hypothetical protein